MEKQLALQMKGITKRFGSVLANDHVDLDVYRGEIDAQPVYWKVLLYASLFHQCIAGPIVR